MDFDSEYVVEDYIKPKKIRKPLINDDSADLLGNFDDKKRKEIEKNPNFNLTNEEDPFASDSDFDEDSIDEDDEKASDEEANDEEANDEDADTKETNGENIDEEQLPQSTSDTETDAKLQKTTKIKKKKKNESVEVDERPPDAGKVSGNLSNQQITSLMKGASKQNRFVLYVTNLNYDTSKERLSEFFQKVGEVKSVRIPKNRKTAFAFVEMDDLNGFKVSILHALRML